MVKHCCWLSAGREKAHTSAYVEWSCQLLTSTPAALLPFVMRAAGPPPVMGMLPPPAMLPPAGSILPPPAMGPPGSSILPPPAGPPPGAVVSKAAAAASVSKPAGTGATTITGASTVAKRPLAHKDKALTAMVPASVLVRREAAAKGAAAAGDDEELKIGPGFGLAPVQKAAGPGGRGQAKQQLQPPQMGRWGNAVKVTSVPAGSGGSKAAAKAPAAAAGGGVAGGRVDDKLADFMSSLKDLGAFE